MWQEDWLASDDPFEAYGIWETHWLDEHPDDTDKHILELIDIYYIDADVKKLSEKGIA